MSRHRVNRRRVDPVTALLVTGVTTFAGVLGYSANRDVNEYEQFTPDAVLKVAEVEFGQPLDCAYAVMDTSTGEAWCPDE